MRLKPFTLASVCLTFIVLNRGYGRFQSLRQAVNTPETAQQNTRTLSQQEAVWHD